MKKESLKDWCKNWSLDDLVSNIVSAGMTFMVDKMSSQELTDYKRVMIKEIRRRIKKS